MPLSRDEVFWLYQALLGRVPESEEVYELHMTMHHDFHFARHTFMASKEFQDKMYPPTYYRGGESLNEFIKPRDLALATMVKNEEKNIELMLRSVLPIVDFVAILDTGSSDQTREIAKTVLENEKIPFVISDAPFVNFSQARNDALDLVPLSMKWALMLDADEHLVPEDYHLFSKLLTSNADAWALPRYSFTDEEKLAPVQSYPDYQRRLVKIRNHNPVRFSGTVHENIVDPFIVDHAPANTARFLGTEGGPHIHHMGGVTTSAEELRRKLAFYMNLSNAETT